MSENITNNPSVPSQVVAEVKFPRFVNNLGIIPTSYKDSMSYYETLAWLCNYLQETVIPTVNQNGDAVEELQSLYIELNSYVTHYFDNLNVQTEINNKLDEMVETGQLQEIVSQYFKPIEDNIELQFMNQNETINEIRNTVTSLINNNPIPVTNISDMTDTTKIYVLTTNGKWYYYGNDTWNIGGDYQAEVTTNQLTTLQNTKATKTTIFNVYNPTTITDGYINPTTGGKKSSANFYTSDFIYLANGETITIESIVRSLAVYDTSKTFTSSIIDINTWGPVTYTATSDCYVKFSVQTYLRNNVIAYIGSVKDRESYIPLAIEENVKLNPLQIAQIESVLMNIYGYNSTTIDLDIIDDHVYTYTTNTITDNSNMQYAVVDVKIGEIYQIEGYVNNYFCLACLVAPDTTRTIFPGNGYSASLQNVNTEIIIPYTGKLYINKFNTRTVSLIKKTPKIYDLGNLQTLLKSNPLYGKKIAYLGDSFTHGDFSNSLTDDYTITSGLYIGEYKVYPYLIGNTNNMNVQNLAVNGMTLAQYENSSNVLSKDGGAYTEIDNDTDYIIIKIGINDDTHHHNIPIGSITDTSNTTFYGAYNKVVSYLIEHYPEAKIGLIASNGISNTGYIEATLNIARKYGLACLNESTDYNIPLLIRTLKTDVLESVRNARDEQWFVNPNSNYHPNAKAHEFEASIVENFIKSL